MRGWRRACIILTTCMVGVTLVGCVSSGGTEGAPHNENMSFDQFAQTDFNRTVTIAMRDNLDSLSRLLEKLYRRNPAEWRKTGAISLEDAVQQGQQAIPTGQAPAALDRKSVVSGKSGSVRVDLGGRPNIKKKTHITK